MTPEHDQATADRHTHEDFLTCLSIQARRRYERTPATYILVLAAVANGWRPQQLAQACSRNLPTAPLAAAQQIQRALAWAGENKPPAGRTGLAAVKPKRKPTPDGCQHTTDPNGWLMNAEGSITGKCPCWPGGAA
jgi:hypothetical protein